MSGAWDRDDVAVAVTIASPSRLARPHRITQDLRHALAQLVMRIEPCRRRRACSQTKLNAWIPAPVARTGL